MAENTRLKDLAVDVKRILELMETRHTEYTSRIEKLEEGSSASSLAHHNVFQPFQVRSVKLDFPRFNGSNVLEWIFKVEQFFTYYNTLNDHRLMIAAVHLDADVIPWFQMLTKNNPFHSWVGFTRALEMEFGPSPYECPRSTLFKLAQTGSVQDYYKEFTALANRVYGVMPDALLDCFISGLKPDIRRDVIAQAPTSMIRTISLAKLYEEKYIPKHKPYQPHSLQKTLSYPITQTQKTTSLPPLLTTPTATQHTQTHNKYSNIKNISAVEIRLRREKGLCFTCDEKFSPGHKCPNKQYLLLQVEMNEQDSLEPDPQIMLYLTFKTYRWNLIYHSMPLMEDQVWVL